MSKGCREVSRDPSLVLRNRMKVIIPLHKYAENFGSPHNKGLGIYVWCASLPSMLRWIWSKDLGPFSSQSAHWKIISHACGIITHVLVLHYYWKLGKWALNDEQPRILLSSIIKGDFVYSPIFTKFGMKVDLSFVPLKAYSRNVAYLLSVYEPHDHCAIARSRR